VTVELATLTSESSLPVNGTESEPNAPTPTLADSRLFFSAKRSWTAFTKAIVRALGDPVACADDVELDLDVRFTAGWKLLRPRTWSAGGDADHVALAEQRAAALPRRPGLRGRQRFARRWCSESNDS
jgi:hypothetical protein